MIEILEFVFSPFWVWLGSTIMLGAVSAGLGNALSQVRGIISYHLHR